MESIDFEADLNIVCPNEIKNYLLGRRKFLHPHFYSKSQVMDSAFPTFEDEDVLVYAYQKNITYAISKKFFSGVRLLKEKPSGTKTTNTIEKLYRIKAEIEDMGLLHEPDSISGYSLTCRPTIVLGYSSHDTDLVAAFNTLGVKYRFADLSLCLDEGKSPFTGTVEMFKESWIEAIFGFSWLCSKIKSEIDDYEIDYSKFAIVCPQDYFNLVQNTAMLFNVPVSIPIDTAKNLPEASKILKEIRNGADLDSMIEEVDTMKNQSLRKVCVKALSTIYTLQSERGIIPTSKLFYEYMGIKLDSPFSFNRSYQGIKVTNNIDSISPCKHLLVLGFSDALISSGKDNGQIQDAYKEDYSYESTTTEKNKAKEISIRNFLSVCDDVHLSKAKSDNFRAYNSAFFVKRCEWLKEVEEDRREYESYLVAKDWEGRHKRYDVAFYNSIFRDRYAKIRVMDDFAEAIESLPDEKRVTAYHTYDNDFDWDEETQEYFRNMFAGTIKLSHSSLDMYQRNPFSYFCSYVLKLSSPTHFSNILGQLIHAHAEEREDFDLDKTIDNLLNDPKHPMMEELEGMNRKQQIYFMHNADKVFENEVLPSLREIEDYLHLRQVRPTRGDEFHGTIEMSGNSIFTCFFDQVYTLDDKEYVLVDYKTSKYPKKYVDRTYSLVGRLLQLPLYDLAFEEVMRQNGQKEMKLAGSYICSIPYSEPYRLSLKNILTGYTLSNTPFYDKNDARERLGLDKSDPIRDLSVVKQKNSNGEESMQYKELVKLSTIQNHLTKGKSFSPEIDSTFPYGSPDTCRFDPLEVNERIGHSALTAYYNCLNYLRNGRLPVKVGDHEFVRWFPIYPTMIYKNGSKYLMDDEFPDISFREPDQFHLISIAAFDENTTMHDDYDDMMIPNGDYSIYGDDDDRDEDGDNGDKSERSE